MVGFGHLNIMDGVSSKYTSAGYQRQKDSKEQKTLEGGSFPLFFSSSPFSACI